VFVLGIDPGLTRCGYGGVRQDGGRLRAEAAGVLTTSPAEALPARLFELQANLRALLAELRPDAVAVERVFFQSNVRTASTSSVAGRNVSAAVERWA